MFFDPKHLKTIEMVAILKSLIEHGGNRTYTAKELDIPYRTLTLKLAQYRKSGISIPKPGRRGKGARRNCD